jgi:hypothetical protein
MESKEKVIIFDSSSIISLALNGILDILKELKSVFNGKFIIPREVKRETIEKPINIKKFELEALKIKNLLDDKILELPESININNYEIERVSQDILRTSNNLFIARGKPIHIIDKGEAECLALSKLCEKKNIKNVITVDERTTRMLCENINNLKKLLEKKLHTRVKYKKKTNFLSSIQCIRSAELLYIAHQKNLVKLKNGNVLDALLYAVKFKGCAISDKEILELKRIAKEKN